VSHNNLRHNEEHNDKDKDEEHHKVKYHMYINIGDNPLLKNKAGWSILAPP